MKHEWMGVLIVAAAAIGIILSRERAFDAAIDRADERTHEVQASLKAAEARLDEDARRIQITEAALSKCMDGRAVIWDGETIWLLPVGMEKQP